MGLKRRPKQPHAEPCFCERNPYPWTYGGDPEKAPGIEYDPPGVWGAKVRCVHCGTRWTVTAIPGGGIYGDVHWQREAT